MKHLFEMLTDKGCDSYERCYAWARDEADAISLFHAAHPVANLCQVNELF
jgi:hypothetical protein